MNNTFHFTEIMALRVELPMSGRSCKSSFLVSLLQQTHTRSAHHHLSGQCIVQLKHVQAYMFVSEPEEKERRGWFLWLVRI